MTPLPHYWYTTLLPQIHSPRGSIGLGIFVEGQITDGNLQWLIVTLEGSEILYHGLQGEAALLDPPVPPHCHHPPSLWSLPISHTDFSVP